MLKAIHAREDRQAAEEKFEAVCKKLKKVKLSEAAKLVEKGTSETLSYYALQVSIAGHCAPTTHLSG